MVAAVLVGACAPAPVRRIPAVLYASGADLQSINPLVGTHPLARQIQNHVLFMTLAAYDSSFAAHPRLAADWRWSDARRTLTIRLRPDVRWHDRTPTTATDVVWTLNMARDPRVAYPRARDLSNIVGVEVVDSLQVRIRFARPTVFPDVLTDLAILPARYFAGVAPEEIRTHAFNRHPVGNGPYRFVAYQPNQRWVFARWDAFPADLGPARLDRFVVVVVDESATKLAALTSGELDVAGINPAHADFVRADPRLEVVEYPLLFPVALVWNLRRAPFDDIRVRRALTRAIDRRTLVDAYVYGFGTVAHGPVSPAHPWYVPVDSEPYDPLSAGRLLDQAGWRRGADGVRVRDGRRLAFDLLAVTSGDNPLEQLIQAQLAGIGVAVRIRVRELSAFLDAAQGAARTYDALVVGVPGDLSLGYLAAMYGSPEGPLAYPGYRNPAFDAAVREARQSIDADAVAAAWARVQRILAADLPTTWLYHARGVQGRNRRLRAPVPDLRGELAGMAHWTLEDRP